MRLIDADAFKQILSEHEMKHDKRRSFNDYDCGSANAYEYAGDLLDEMPTITIPVAELDNTEDFAEWIDRSDGGRIRYPFWKRYECSKCGAKSENTNFCPNCGASMKEGEKNE